MQLQFLDTKKYPVRSRGIYFPAVQGNAGETLISIVVGVFILSLVLFGVMNLLVHNYTVEDDYARNNKIHLLELNAASLIRRLDTSSGPEKEVFYIYKDTATKEFKIFTGASNIAYGYINSYGDTITNTGSYSGALYLRTFFLDQSDTSLSVGNQVIK
jgi:hypothetical protein